MTIFETLQSIRRKLVPVAGDCALPEAERILCFLLDRIRPALYLQGREETPAGLLDRIGAIVDRRVTDEPLAHLLGSAYFYDREFVVSPDALVPRPDTETVVEEVLKNERMTDARFLDLGTGSGCIATILTEHNRSWRGIGLDLSLPALKVASRNGRGALKLLCADRCSAFKHGRFFDFIVSNPPYIASTVMPSLPRSVREFEPLLALDGGVDGLDFYRYLAHETPRLLKSGGRIYCEIGFDQGRSAPALFESSGWNGVGVSKDLGGHPRVVKAIWKDATKRVPHERHRNGI